MRLDFRIGYPLFYYNIYMYFYVFKHTEQKDIEIPPSTRGRFDTRAFSWNRKWVTNSKGAPKLKIEDTRY